jgi:hypothetical protein
MRIFEFARVLQPGSDRSIQTYVSHPDQRNQQCCTVICRNGIRPQKEWPDMRVDGVVQQRSDPGICKIADHGNVWEEKEQYEKAPTTMIPAISHNAHEEDASAFKL